ncbi:MAG: hypothetical protein RLZZ182_1541, partial [Pseudomonadota bacterium]
PPSWGTRQRGLQVVMVSLPFHTMHSAFAPLQRVSRLARQWVAARPQAEAGSPPGLGRWSVLYIDHNGQLQKVLADVQGYVPAERCVVLKPAEQAVTGAQALRLKLNRIAEAIEVHSGRRVLLDRWVSFVTRRGALAS